MACQVVTAAELGSGELGGQCSGQWINQEHLSVGRPLRVAICATAHCHCDVQPLPG